MSGNMILRVFDVEHGACTMLLSPNDDRLAMIDCGHNETTGWRPSNFLKQTLQRSWLDYLLVTNADQDHLSDLNNLFVSGISVPTFYRNPSPGPIALRVIKESQGECTDDIERYLQIYQSFTGPVAVPFNEGMGGITTKMFWNTYPEFTDTNNLSLVVFIQFGGFKMLFPGDLEAVGWKKLLQNPSFVSELMGTTILVASHHGRETGLYEEIFQFFTPLAVVISDKGVCYESQETVPNYRCFVDDAGVYVSNLNKSRHVLTTRRDGDILFQVSPSGVFNVTTTKGSYGLGLVDKNP